ncbi:hypothetical protein FNV43_RR10911 [Rhamnella rubrinervis]|uniref:Uncharacterized protein n=1 Tax=Rhamnella rubrinervis TaxID=2594499 RepID=A0A8K0H4Z7_9ROSA|nr:hypothetical protein FNV43_RR10911 [Rhamnella rubrinervis]
MAVSDVEFHLVMYRVRAGRMHRYVDVPYIGCALRSCRCVVCRHHAGYRTLASGRYVVCRPHASAMLGCWVCRMQPNDRVTWVCLAQTQAPIGTTQVCHVRPRRMLPGHTRVAACVLCWCRTLMSNSSSSNKEIYEYGDIEGECPDNVSESNFSQDEEEKTKGMNPNVHFRVPKISDDPTRPMMREAAFYIAFFEYRLRLPFIPVFREIIHE